MAQYTMANFEKGEIKVQKQILQVLLLKSFRSVIHFIIWKSSMEQKVRKTMMRKRVKNVLFVIQN